MKIIISCCRLGTSEEQCCGQECGRGWRWLQEAGEPTHQGDEVTRTEIEATNRFSTFHRRLFIHAWKAPLAVKKLATLLGPKINNSCMHQPPFYRMQRRCMENGSYWLWLCIVAGPSSTLQDVSLCVAMYRGPGTEDAAAPALAGRSSRPSLALAGRSSRHPLAAAVRHRAGLQVHRPRAHHRHPRTDGNVQCRKSMKLFKHGEGPY